MARMVGANEARPCGVSSCSVILRWKLSMFTPLNERAYPLVGSVWFVPEA